MTSRIEMGYAKCHLFVKLLSGNARPPCRHSEKAAGYDLSSAEAVEIKPQEWALVGTGVALSLPPGTYGRVAPRSGLSLRGTTVGAGVIDEDYRGEVKVLLFNHHPSNTLSIEVGDRIAQLIVTPILTPIVGVVDDLDFTARGEGGFGSTAGF